MRLTGMVRPQPHGQFERIVVYLHPCCDNGAFGGEITVSDQGGGIGMPDPPKPDLPADPLRAVLAELRTQNRHLKDIRTYVALTCLFTAITAAFIAAWLLGLIEVEFRPLSRRL